MKKHYQKKFLTQNWLIYIGAGWYGIIGIGLSLNFRHNSYTLELPFLYITIEDIS